MINTGEVDQSGAGNLSLFSGTFDNQAGGTYDLSGTGGVTGAGTFADEGTIKMTGSGTATLSVFSALNAGTIDVASGTLSIASVDSHWTGGGTLDAALGATLQLAPAAGGDNGIQLSGTYTGSGGGAVELTTGALQIGSSGATFDFPHGLFQWRGGSINVDLGGTLTNTTTGFIGVDPGSGNSVAIMSGALALGGTINVESGTLLLEAASVTGSDVSFTVAAGATVNLSGPAYTGSFTGSGGGTVGFGTLSVGSGGATFDFPAGMFQWDGGFVDGPGSLTNSGAMTLDGAGDSLESGVVLVNSGTLTVSGDGETLAGGTVDNSGSHHRQLHRPVGAERRSRAAK